jgi:hypothetical protein
MLEQVRKEQSWAEDIREWIHMVGTASRPGLKEKIREGLAHWTREERDYRPHKL